MPRDYYEVLGVGREAGDDEIKKAFRAARARAAPGHQPPRPRGGEQVQGGRGGLRGAERPRAARRLRPLRARRPAHRAAGSRASGGFGNISDIFEAFFGGGDPFGAIFGGRGRAGSRARPRRRGPGVSLTLEEVLTGASRRSSSSRSPAQCSHCNGNGAEPGTPIETCPRCEGTGQLQSVARTVFGQVVRTQACDRCGGDGRIAKTPCERVPRHRPRGRGAQADGGHPGRHRRRAARAAQRPGPRGCAGRAGRETCTCWCTVEPDPRFERHGEDLITRLDVPFTQAALGRDAARADARGRGAGRARARLAAGQRHAPARTRPAVAARPAAAGTCTWC